MSEIKKTTGKTVVSVNVETEAHTALLGILESHGNKQRRAAPSYSEFLRYGESAMQEVLRVAMVYHQVGACEKGKDSAYRGDASELLFLEDSVSEDMHADPATLEFWSHPVLYAAYMLLDGFVRTTPNFAQVKGRNSLDYLGSLVKFSQDSQKHMEDEAEEHFRLEREEEEGQVERQREVVALRPILSALGLDWIERSLNLDESHEGNFTITSRAVDDDLEAFANLVASYPELAGEYSAAAAAQTIFDTLAIALRVQSEHDFADSQLADYIVETREALNAARGIKTTQSDGRTSTTQAQHLAQRLAALEAWLAYAPLVREAARHYAASASGKAT